MPRFNRGNGVKMKAIKNFLYDGWIIALGIWAGIIGFIVSMFNGVGFNFLG